MQSLENAHFIAHLRQVACTSQARRTATDNRYTMTILLGQLLLLAAVLNLPIAHKSFELTDRNRLTLNT